MIKIIKTENQPKSSGGQNRPLVLNFILNYFIDSQETQDSKYYVVIKFMSLFYKKYAKQTFRADCACH